MSFFKPFSILQFYSFSDIAESAELPGGFIIGAGAGSSKFVGVNCEVNLLQMTPALIYELRDHPSECTFMTLVFNTETEWDGMGNHPWNGKPPFCSCYLLCAMRNQAESHLKSYMPQTYFLNNCF